MTSFHVFDPSALMLLFSSKKDHFIFDSLFLTIQAWPFLAWKLMKVVGKLLNVKSLICEKHTLFQTLFSNPFSSPNFGLPSDRFPKWSISQVIAFPTDRSPKWSLSQVIDLQSDRFPKWSISQVIALPSDRSPNWRVPTDGVSPNWRVPFLKGVEAIT